MSRRSRKLTPPEQDLWRLVTRDVAPLIDGPVEPGRKAKTAAEGAKAPEMPRSVSGPMENPAGGLGALAARLARSGAAPNGGRAPNADEAFAKPALSKRPRVLPPSYTPPQSRPKAESRPKAQSRSKSEAHPNPGSRATLEDGRTPAIEARTRRRLNRGQTEPDARIDLHGMRQAAAHEALRSFVLMSRARGHRLVLVVTGKGEDVGTPARLAANEGRGVIRRAVPRWLALADMAPHVIGHEPAGPRHGGSGALYVRLKR